MTASLRDYVEILTGDRLRITRASSANLAGNYPFLLERGIIDPQTGEKVPGLPIGTCGRNGSGGIMYFDPVQLYRSHIVENTNVKTFGMVGNRKSAGVKSRIMLGTEVGWNYIVTDIKGEYDLLAGAITGSKVLRFGSDDSLRLNMIDNSLSVGTQHELVQAATLSAIGESRSTLTPTEIQMLWYGILDAHAGNDHPILQNLVDYVSNPSDRMVKEMQISAKRLKEHGTDIRLALTRLNTGDLRGTFHEQTTPGLFDVVPLLVLNCKGLKGAKLAIMLVVLNFLTYNTANQLKGQASRFDYVIHDEAWDLIGQPGFLASIRSLFKLGNSEGVSNEIVAHHASNLFRSGNAAVGDLFADSAITILYKQDREEIEEHSGLLNLNTEEIKTILRLMPGEALYKIGDHPGIEVQHTTSNHPRMRPLVETRKQLLGHEN